MSGPFFAKAFPAHSLRILSAFTAHFYAIFCTLLNAGCIRLHPRAQGLFCEVHSRAFLSIVCAFLAHYLRILHSAHRFFFKYQDAPRFVHSCALLCILCNDVHSSLGGGSCGNAFSISSCQIALNAHSLGRRRMLLNAMRMHSKAFKGS